MGGPTAAEVGRVAVSLARQGATITQNKTGWKVTFPNGDMMVLHRTYGDVRTLDNIRAKVRRHGFTWPLEDSKAVKAAEKAARASEGETVSAVTAAKAEYTYPAYLRNGSASPKVQTQVREAADHLESLGHPVTQTAITNITGRNPSDVNRALYVMGWRYGAPIRKGEPRVWVRSDEAEVTPIDRHRQGVPIPDEPTPQKAEPVPAEPEPEAAPPVPDGDERPQEDISEVVDRLKRVDEANARIDEERTLPNEPMPPAEYPLPAEAQVQPKPPTRAEENVAVEENVRAAMAELNERPGEPFVFTTPEEPRERIVLDDHDSWTIEPDEFETWAKLQATATKMGLCIEVRVWRAQ